MSIINLALIFVYRMKCQDDILKNVCLQSNLKSKHSMKEIFLKMTQNLVFIQRKSSMINLIVQTKNFALAKKKKNHRIKEQTTN